MPCVRATPTLCWRPVGAERLLTICADHAPPKVCFSSFLVFPPARGRLPGVGRYSPAAVRGQCWLAYNDYGFSSLDIVGVSKIGRSKTECRSLNNCQVSTCVKCNYRKGVELFAKGLQSIDCKPFVFVVGHEAACRFYRR